MPPARPAPPPARGDGPRAGRAPCYRLPDDDAALPGALRERRAPAPRPGAHPPPVELVAIGASAGGVDALLKLLSPLGPSCAPAVVVVLHIPEDRDSRLVEVFAHHCALPVREAADKAPVQPGTVYFAGAGYHLSVERDRSFSLSCEPPLHHSRPSIDLLFESAADAYGAACAAFLLTGASADGADGLCRVGARGGLTVVQSPTEAQVATMPAAALARCSPDFVLGLADIQRLLSALAAPPRAASLPPVPALRNPSDGHR
ncbi:MAG: chemotaxis protein CheB [Xylophilus ampelinus]